MMAPPVRTESSLHGAQSLMGHRSLSRLCAVSFRSRSRFRARFWVPHRHEDGVRQILPLPHELVHRLLPALLGQCTVMQSSG